MVLSAFFSFPKRFVRFLNTIYLRFISLKNDMLDTVADLDNADYFYEKRGKKRDHT